jgi:NADPH:quinone reductase-like Zn-dependent oxidoreductase
VKGILLERCGPPSVLRLSELPDPEPESDEVRVRVRAIGVNYAEVLSRRGLYGWAPARPYILGMEAFGEIEALGPDARHRGLGEAVVVGAQHGCYAEAVCVPARQARPAVRGFSPEENAAFAVNFMTAWVALVEMARLRPTDRVLVQAAAGGVGSAAVGLAKAFGCTVYGAVGSDAKLETVRGLGADAVVNYRMPGWDRQLRELAEGSGVDVVLELVGGEVHRRSVELLAPLGRVVVAGFAESLTHRRWNPLSWWRMWRSAPRMGLPRMAERSHGLLASHLGYLLRETELVERLWNALLGFVTEHGLRPIVGATFPLEQAAEAHALMESRRSTGKIVLLPETAR